mgnify:CR=1 FL=1
MKRLILLFVLFAAFSCAGTGTQVLEPAESHALSLVSELSVPADPASLPDAERINLEGTAVKILAAKTAAIAPLLASLEDNPSGDKRMAIIRLLAMIVNRLPEGDARADTSALIEKAGARLMKSSVAADRHAGAILMALAAKSQLMPAAIELLDDDDLSNRTFAIRVLSEVANIDLGYFPAADASARKEAVKRWRYWWRQNENRAFYYMPDSNPILSALTSEAASIARSAGPYQLEVVDPDGNAVPGAVVAYSYFFTTFDGKGDKLQERTSTDENGRVLMTGKVVATGMQFVGAQVIIAKAGWRESGLTLAPHVLTKNSYTIRATIERVEP